MTWANALQLAAGLLVDLNWPSMLNPPESCKDPQVIAVSPSALSGFRLRPPAGAIQEDLLKPRFCPGQRHRRRTGTALGELPGIEANGLQCLGLLTW